MATEVRHTDRPILAGAKRVAMAATAGAAMGGLIGGVGGRLAMLILRLTSDPSLHGIESDDGFTIGIVSSQTTFLVMFTAVVGAVGGLVYAIVRTWPPTAGRAWVFGALTGLVGGAIVIHPDGIDFRLVEPLALAIVLFVAIPVLYGAAVSSLIERWLRASAVRASNAWLIVLVPALLPFVLLGPRGLPFVLLMVGAVVVATPGGPADRFLSSRPIVWLGRTTLAAGGIAAGIALVGDVVEIL